MENTPPEHVRIRRLLALKAHEKPPPGTFNDLRRAVRARIEAEAARQPTAMERLLQRVTGAWPQWLQPATVIPTGFAVLLVAGLVLRQPNRPGIPTAPNTHQAGLSSLFDFTTNQQVSIPRSLGLTPGMTYRIEIQTDDATATPQSIRIIPLGPAPAPR
jgi:hypothetical protein